MDTPEGLDNFLSKVDEVTSLISEIKSSDNTQDVIQKADMYIEKIESEDGMVKNDKTIINKSNSNAVKAIPPTIPADLPDGVTPEQAAFMATFEQDAKERANRRKKREADSLIPKEKGNKSFKAGDYETAIRFYLEAVSIDPANPLLYTNCAQAYLKLGKFEDAADRCDIALRADEKCVKAYLRLGIAKSALGQYDEARAAFKQAKALSPPTQHKLFERHIEDTNLAEEICEREKEVFKGHECQDKFHTLERACVQLARSNLTLKEMATVATEVRNGMTGLPLQDLFRLRLGTRLLSQPHIKSLVVSARDNSNEAALKSLLDMFASAISSNEASCRDLFCRSNDELTLCFTLLEEESNDIQESVLALLVQGCCSLRVREWVAKHNNKLGYMRSVINTINLACENKRFCVGALAFDLGSKLSTEKEYRRQLFDEFEYHFDLIGESLVCKGNVGKSSMKYLLQLSAGIESRALLGQDNILIKFETILRRITAKCINNSTEGIVTLGNLLGVLTNISLQPSVAEYLQRGQFIGVVTALFEFGSVVQLRVATLICRLCTTEAYTQALIHNDLIKRILQLSLNTQSDTEMIDVFARLIIKCSKLSTDAKSLFIKEDVHMLLASLLKLEHSKVVGNIALGIAELATDKEVCRKLTNTPVITDLMTHARKDKSAITENCGVAIARLAAGNGSHLTRLKQLDGFEVIHSRVSTR